MSQFFQGVTAGALPPTVPTSFVTQNGTAVPLSNVLIVNGNTSTQNNNNGIISKGGVVGTGTSNEVDIVLTNRIVATVTTTDGAVPVATQLYSFALGATPGTYLFTQDVIAYNITDSIGLSVSGKRGVRTSGAAGTLIGSDVLLNVDEGAFLLAEVVNSISGNNAILTVTGLANKTIDWLVLTTYVFVS